jgi:hypothetical protein
LEAIALLVQRQQAEVEEQKAENSEEKALTCKTNDKDYHSRVQIKSKMRKARPLKEGEPAADFITDYTAPVSSGSDNRSEGKRAQFTVFTASSLPLIA